MKELEGKKVFESDSLIIELLKKKNIFFKEEKIVHSYPHCWRCKNPVIFRATKQWFLDIDKNGLREKILSEVERTEFYPAVAKKRITSMIKLRPDWCLSRQRLWGVPVPVLYCVKCDGYIATEESFKKIEEIILKMGSDGWFQLTANEILNGGKSAADEMSDTSEKFKCKCGSVDFKKGEDILDVWFDSGVSHFAVLANNKNLKWPADIYIEGSDQHRGWFQTSLITSVALRNRAPYKSVFTHGFIVDADSKKMSKSIGNVISPQKIVEKYGADLLRLWVANENYFKDIKISDEILNQTVTYYRRIRNTIRFVLGNIGDLKIYRKVEYEDLTSLDKFILHKFTVMLEEIIENFDNYLFFKSIKNIHDFCNNWLSSFYFNILKDRLYVSKEDSHKRRSSQTVLKILGENLLKMIAPILSHTAEEGWQNLIGEDSNLKESIFLCDFPEVLSKWKNLALNDEWEKIVELRNIVLKSIEYAKEKEIIKDPLESTVLISINPDSKEIIKFIEERKEDWKEYFIVSKVDIEKKSHLKDGAEFMGALIKIEIKKAAGEKCARCWIVTDGTGDNSTHPALCSRCVEVI